MTYNQYKYFTSFKIKWTKIEQFLKKIGRKYNDSLIVYYHLIHDEQQLLLIENQIHNGFIF